MFKISGSIKNYAWGAVGSASEVARIKYAGDESFIINETEPYAEIWMGTHPGGPSDIILPNGEVTSLESFAKDHGDLRYLLKVLSVNKALSIQAHPNKLLAPELHRDNPSEYRDPNHKPEMAIALKESSALCGLSPLATVRKHLNHYAEVMELFSADNRARLIEQYDSSGDDLVSSLFFDVLQSSLDHFQGILSRLLSRLQHRAIGLDYELDDVLLDLSRQFPQDVSILSPIFMNLLHLSPFQSIYISPHTPHAYLPPSTFLECMACSDNVCRGGLTPKFRDLPSFMRMVRGSDGGRVVHAVKTSSSIDDDQEHCVMTYTVPDVDEFEIDRIHCRPAGAITPYACRQAIWLVLEGEGRLIRRDAADPKEIKRGSILYVLAGEVVDVQSTGLGLLIFRCHERN